MSKQTQQAVVDASRQKTEKSSKKPSIKVRWSFMVIENLACAILILFPVMKLEYITGIYEEFTIAYCLETTMWEIPYKILQIAFYIALACLVVPLFTDRMPKKPVLIVMLCLAIGFFGANVAAHVAIGQMLENHSFGALVLQNQTLTTVGWIYVVVSLFAVLELVLMLISIYKENPSKKRQARMKKRAARKM